MMRWGIVIAITAGIGLTLPKKYWIIYAFGALAVILVGLGIVITFISRYAARTKKS
jgi:membrane protein YdbS with pleckstrin-like domain